MNAVKRTLIYSASICTPFFVPYTTSTSTSIKLHALVEVLKLSKDVSSIHRSCLALATEFKDSPNISSQPSPNDDVYLSSVLQTLAVSARPQDMRRIEQILHDFYPILGMKPTSEVYTSIFLGLANDGHNDEVLNFLIKMPQLQSRFTPTLEQVHAVLAACSQHSSFQLLKDIVVNIQEMGQPPTNETFTILLRLCWRIAKRDDDIPSINELSWIIHESVRQRLAFDPNMAEILYQSYADIGRVSEAMEISSLYKSVSSILCDSRDYRDILQLERTHGVKSTAVHWSIVLNNCLRSGNSTEAFEVYEQSKKAGISPDAAFISPLLRTLGLSDMKGPSDESINRALDIYRELADTVPPSMHHHPSNPNLNVHSTGPDIGIYNTLFRMLLASRSETDYLSIADSLLKDMEVRNLPTNSSTTTASKIIIGMRRAKTYAGALDFYRKHQCYLDDHDYAALLQVYCRLSVRGKLEAARYASRRVKARSKVKDDQQALHCHDEPQVDMKFKFYKYHFL